MKLTMWKDNRVDGEHEMAIEEIARLYLESSWADQPMNLERKVRSFMTDPDGPISSVWTDDETFQRLLDLIAAAG
jgi:hypothetical protein